MRTLFEKGAIWYENCARNVEKCGKCVRKVLNGAENVPERA